MKTIVILTLLSVLSSCTSAPRKEELENADYGIAPRDEFITQTYEETVRRTLLDPNSLQSRNIRQPKKFWAKYGDGLDTYWIICGEVNAKNRFGGYTGFTPQIVWTKNGSSGVVQTIPGNPGCVLAPQKQDVDPCGYYRNVSDFFKCK